MQRQAFTVESPAHRALRALNYSPEVERFRSRCGQRSVRLGDLLTSMGRAYGTVFTRIDCDRANGVELISQSDMFAAEPAGRIIRLDSMVRPELHRVRRWQVLIAGAGTLGENELYGRSIIADARLEGRFVGPHAMVLTFDDEGGDLNLFAYAFLCSRIGVKAVRSASYGTKILGIRKDILSELPIPLPDESTVQRVARLIRRTVASRELFAQRLASARELLEALPDMQEAKALCEGTRARCLTWAGELTTLAAWNYASAGDALELLTRRWAGRVADLVVDNGIFNGPRFARIECSPPNGIDFYSQRDVFIMRPVPQRIRVPRIPERLLFVEDDMILAGSHGQLTEGGVFGRVELAAFGLAGAGLTQDILRLKPKAGCQQRLFGFLSTEVGQRLFKTTAVGTSIPSVRIDLLEKVPVPELEPSHATALSRNIDEAIAARLDASRSENEAIRIVEEEILPRWLA